MNTPLLDLCNYIEAARENLEAAKALASAAELEKYGLSGRCEHELRLRINYALQFVSEPFEAKIQAIVEDERASIDSAEAAVDRASY